MTGDAIIISCPRCRAKNRIPAARKGDRAVCGKCKTPLPLPKSFPDHPVEVTDQTFAREVLQQAGPVLVDCWAPWCGPCRTVGPIMDQLAGAYAGRVKIAKLNTDQNQRIAGQFQILSIPTLLFFKGGQLVNRQVGALPKNEIERLIRSIM
jgi:thioredoxin 2